jgi:hypothetical protein
MRTNCLSPARPLTEEQRDRLDPLTHAILRAYADRDLATALAIHLRIVDALFQGSRAACRAPPMP